MEPLDLTKQPPRGPREQLFDTCFIPRTIDKIRAELPGGNLGGYFVDLAGGLSAYLLHKLKVDVGELRGVVASAKDEAEVAAWLQEHADFSERERINRRVLSMTVGEMPPQMRPFFEQLYGKGLDDASTVCDVLEKDDAKLHA